MSVDVPPGSGGAGGPSSPSKGSGAPFVGRQNELAQLRSAVARCRSGTGSAWTLVGPGGIGKTRLLRALEGEAAGAGLKVRWGYCLKESLAPFFPIEQVFRRSGEVASRPDTGATGSAEGTTVLFEEDRPRAIHVRTLALGADRPVLLISRDRPATLRQRFPTLAPAAQLLWLTRAEGPESIPPGSLDALGERIDSFLQANPGGVVGLSGLEYLVSQNTFLPVLRLVQMLRDATESTGGHFLLSVNAATLEPRERSLLEAEAEVVREEVGPGHAPEEAPAPPALRLLRFLEALQEDARGAPQLIVLDDLQWADAQSRVAFQFLIRNSRDLPVMFVAGLRDEADEERALPGEDSLQETLDHLEQEGILRQVRLKGLEAGAAQELVRGLVGAPLALGPSDRAFLDLLERTEGNPYFLLESLQQLLDQGLLRREGDHAVFALRGDGPSGAPAGTRERPIPLPPTIRRLVTRRLEGLPAPEMRFLVAACVVGSEFDLAPVAAVTGVPPSELEDLAASLSSRHRLLQPGGKEGTWEFAHPLVWEVLREGLPKTQERQQALLLARWWERERPDEPAVVARLFYTARDRDGVLRWVPRAIEPAMAAHAADAVLRFLRWREELLSTGPEDQRLRAELERPVLLRLNSAGAGSTARKLAQELVALPLDPPLRWEIRLAFALVEQDVDAEEGKAQLEALDAEVFGPGAGATPDLRGRVLNALSVNAINAGHWEEGLKLHERFAGLPAKELAASTAFSGQLAHAWCLQATGEIPQAVEGLERAGRLLDLGRPTEDTIRFHNAQGAIRYLQGNLRPARSSFEAAAGQAHGAGNINLEVLYRGNLANVLWNLGEYDAALAELDQALSLAEKFQFERGTALLLRVQGAVYRDVGRYDDSEASLRRARAWYQAKQNDFILTECDQALATFAGLRGDPAATVRALEELEGAVRAHVSVALAEYFLDRARFRRLAGDLAGARRDLEEATSASKRSNHSELFQARVLYGRALLEEAEGDREKARQDRDRALSTFRGLGVVRYQGRSLDELAQGLARGSPTAPGTATAPHR